MRLALCHVCLFRVRTVSDRVLRQNFTKAVLSLQDNHTLSLRSSQLLSNIHSTTRLFERKGAEGTVGLLMGIELRGYLCISMSQLLLTKEAGYRSFNLTLQGKRKSKTKLQRLNTRRPRGQK